MSPEAEADLKEHSGAGMALQNCLQLRERAALFISYKAIIYYGLILWIGIALGEATPSASQAHCLKVQTVLLVAGAVSYSAPYIPTRNP